MYTILYHVQCNFMLSTLPYNRLYSNSKVVIFQRVPHLQKLNSLKLIIAALNN